MNMVFHCQNRGLIIKTYFRIYHRFKEWFCHHVQNICQTCCTQQKKKEYGDHDKLFRIQNDIFFYCSILNIYKIQVT